MVKIKSAAIDDKTDFQDPVICLVTDGYILSSFSPVIYVCNVLVEIINVVDKIFFRILKNLCH